MQKCTNYISSEDLCKMLVLQTFVGKPSLHFLFGKFKFVIREVEDLLV